MTRAEYVLPPQGSAETRPEYMLHRVALSMEAMIDILCGIEDAAEQTAKYLRQIASASEEAARQSRRR